jgi:hypothetical protein
MSWLISNHFGIDAFILAVWARQEENAKLRELPSQIHQADNSLNI